MQQQQRNELLSTDHALQLLCELGKEVYKRQMKGNAPLDTYPLDGTSLRDTVSRGLSRYRENSKTRTKNFPLADKRNQLPAKKKIDYVAANIAKYPSSTPSIKKGKVKPKQQSQIKTTKPRTSKIVQSLDSVSVDAVPVSEERNHPSKEVVHSDSGALKRRSNVVMHYPFCDDAATVGDLLGGAVNTFAPLDSVSKPDFASIPPPMQKKLISDVFDDFRTGKESMRVADVNAGLQVGSVCNLCCGED